MSSVKGTMPESTSTQSRDYNAIPAPHAPLHAWPESTSTQSRDYNISAWRSASAFAAPESTSTQSRDYNTLPRRADGWQRLAGININPVAGLQQAIAHRWRSRWPGRNQHQPSRGITTTYSANNRAGMVAGININPVAGLQL